MLSISQKINTPHIEVSINFSSNLDFTDNSTVVNAFLQSHLMEREWIQPLQNP